MSLVDTHCHIHSADYPLNAVTVLARARHAGVTRLLCVGTDAADSQLAVDFATHYDRVYASIGIHPHDAKHGIEAVRQLDELAACDKVVAVGECGLDYYYDNSPHEDQATLLRAQMQLALRHHLPMIFHVRDAFDDFWPLFDAHPGLRGVLHSFTDDHQNLEKALQRGLCIGANGISTFTKDHSQQEMFASIPLDNLILETDAPFLTPAPLRGRVNEPAFVTHVAKFHADLHSITLEELSVVTSQNATTLFNIN